MEATAKARPKSHGEGSAGGGGPVGHGVRGWRAARRRRAARPEKQERLIKTSAHRRFNPQTFSHDDQLLSGKWASNGRRLRPMEQSGWRRKSPKMPTEVKLVYRNMQVYTWALEGYYCKRTSPCTMSYKRGRVNPHVKLVEKHLWNPNFGGPTPLHLLELSLRLRSEASASYVTCYGRLPNKFVFGGFLFEIM